MRKLTWGTLMAVPVLAAAMLPPMNVQPGSRVWVDGTSTVRGWHCESTQARGTAAASTLDLAQLASAGAAEITVPIASLDCRNGTMNGHMRTALKAAEVPTLRFRATSVAVTPTGEDAGTARMTGTLSIAGEERPATFEGTVAKENGQLRVRGTKRLTMTEWGVRPPTLMMGTMRVNPGVTVGFDVVLKP